MANKLREQAKSYGLDVEQYLSRLIVGFKKSALSEEESTLLMSINQGFSEQFWLRVKELRTKLESRTLSEIELKELQELSEQIEERHAQRMTAIGQLANLRNEDILTTMNKLGIKNGSPL